MKEAIDIGIIPHIFPQLFRLLAGGFTPNTEEKLKKTHYKTLIAIKSSEGKPMTYYCQQVDLEKGSFTYLADYLEKNGYVRRGFVKNDRRKIALFLTEKGQTLTDEILSQFQDHVQQQLDRLNDQERYKFFNAVEDLKEIKKALIERS